MEAVTRVIDIMQAIINGYSSFPLGFVLKDYGSAPW